VSKHGHDHQVGGRNRPPMPAREALERLMAGHERFLRGAPRFNTLPREEMARLAEGQQPYATILGCSDSRVPPEVIFDAGPGELFVIRVAGNVLSAEVAGSLQYAGTHLKTPLFVVLGHDGCGAVGAALESRLHAVEHPSRIQALVESLLPALDRVDLSLPREQALAAAVEANVRSTVAAIQESPEGQARTKEGVLKLVGAIYQIASGRVRLLDQA
jgi:carbonic anhydrase